jgi:tetratricopeptide (TPR) repeat protein
MIALMSILFACASDKSDEGDRFFESGDYQEAVDAYTLYLNIKPRNIKTLYNRGRAHEELGEHDLAMADYEKVLKLDDDHIKARLSIGNIHFRNEDYEKAYYQFDLVVTKHRQSDVALMYRGKANQKLGKLRDALLDYNEAILINSSNGQVYLYRGILKVHNKRRKSACQDFKKAKSLGIAEATTALEKYCS